MQIFKGSGSLFLSLGLALTVIGASARGQGSAGVINTSHFEVQYGQGVPEADARKVADFLQKDYTHLSAALGMEWKGALEVHVCESVGKFMTETGVPKPWRGAIYQRGILYTQPVQALVHRKIFERSLKYELARAILDSAIERGCPRWLVEAFAVHHSGELENLAPPIGAKLASFSDLDQDIQENPNPPQRDDVHYMLGQTMRFFVEKYGEKEAHGVFRLFDGNTGVEKVFKKAFKEDYAASEKSWARFISEHTSTFER